LVQDINHKKVESMITWYKTLTIQMSSP
jgi:hypothetical protein